MNLLQLREKHRLMWIISHEGENSVFYLQSDEFFLGCPKYETNSEKKNQIKTDTANVMRIVKCSLVGRSIVLFLKINEFIINDIYI